MTVINSIADRADELKGWRRELHQHPEICYEEVWTSDFVAAKLESFGIEVHRGMGKTGVVGVLRGNGDSDRAIGLRADIDALPMQELNEFEHKSKIPGRMHACGHDGHTTMLLGAAQYLAETRNFDGTVYFIFQPAEEGGGGGLAMIEDGLFREFDMQTVWGMHNWPSMDMGLAGIHDGVCMANADEFTMVIRGRGGHAAQPHMTLDPIPCGAAIVQSLQTVVSRRVSPVDSAVVSVTIFQAGSAKNVIPDDVRIGGTARCFRKETRKLLEDSIREISESTAALYECEIDFEWHAGYPATVNHAAEAERAAQVMETVIGEDNVDRDVEPSLGGEDFAYMLEEKPGAYIWIGSGPAPAEGMLHGARYDFNDEVLPVGATYWAKLVESELPR
ncbi:MAG: M20 aminoacylase family protein [Pseudomonadota bacterium]|nr:M20 aminoacylase family protein [Pseudomonadota bacterium]